MAETPASRYTPELQRDDGEPGLPQNSATARVDRAGSLEIGARRRPAHGST